MARNNTTRKGGRPKGQNNKTEIRSIRLSKKEDEELVAKAETAEMTVSIYLRNCISKSTITSVNIEQLREINKTRSALAKLGNVLNNLTKQILVFNKTNHGNQAKYEAMMKELAASSDLVDNLKEELTKLQNTIGGK